MYIDLVDPPPKITHLHMVRKAIGQYVTKIDDDKKFISAEIKEFNKNGPVKPALVQIVSIIFINLKNLEKLGS